jgi:hypothetical protein
MSTYKFTSGDYKITIGPTLDGQGLGTMTINGNLDVVGNVTYIHTQDLIIDDPFITVAANNNGSIDYMGIVGQTGPTTFAGLQFNAIIEQWEISPSVDAAGGAIFPYVPIATGNASSGGANTNVQFNNGLGGFGGDANLSYDYTTGTLTLQGHEVFGNIGLAPTPVANAVAVYNRAIGAGGTGLYVISNDVNDELVSKTKAIIFGIIF